MRIAVAGGTGLVGSYVVEAALAEGHDVVVISRSNGIDLLTGAGLDAALEGVGAVIDATSHPGRGVDPAAGLFRAATARLQAAASARGVAQLVILSIVRIDGATEGHAAAKVTHEEAAIAGPVPVTIQRTTQFHEFPAQLIRWAGTASEIAIPPWRVRTVAARTVAEVLVDLAASTPKGRAVDLAGPDERRLDGLARRFVDHMGSSVTIVTGEDLEAPGARLPGAGARLAGPTFEEWLTSADAARMV